MPAEEPFILECKTKAEGNAVDLSRYRYEAYSESRGYIFIRRGGK